MIPIFTLVKRTLIYTTVFILLSIVSQVGGVIFLAGLGLCSLFKLKKRIWRVSLSFGFYLISLSLIVPLLASIGGREALPIRHPQLKPATVITALLFRNYMKKESVQALMEIAALSPKDVKLVYMDACFPFWDGFPLLPHLSHSDGKKVDVAFIYENTEGRPSNSVPNLTGYGIFEDAKKNETNYAEICASKGNFFYSATEWFSHRWADYEVSAKQTKLLCKNILAHPRVKKIFLEPHLQKRWGINHPKMRFQGCHAVRHDDHIHISFE